MPAIVEFRVVVPATGAELRERALRALLDDQLFTVVLLPEQAVPPPTEIQVTFTIRRTTHLPNDEVIISGTLENDSRSITVRAYGLSQPAHASMVVT